MHRIDFSALLPERFEISPLVRRLGELPAGSLLDLGSGTGDDALFLASCGHSVTAVDHNYWLCKDLDRRACASNLRVSVACLDIRHVAVTHGFQIVLFKHVDHLLDTPELLDVLRRVQSASAPRAYNALSILNATDDRQLKIVTAYGEWQAMDATRRRVTLSSGQVVNEISLLFGREAS